MSSKILGLAKPWVWVQPKNDEELVSRLLEARDYAVHERERENLCSCAAIRLTALISDNTRLLDAIQALTTATATRGFENLTADVKINLNLKD